MFPYMVDPNTGEAMYESDDIIAYLFKTYGDGQVPLPLRLGAATVLTAGLGGMARMSKGSQARASTIPDQPVVLWGYEGSPFVKVVRERLCELEIPYLFKSCARGSPKRDEMLEKVGHFQVPFLEVSGPLHIIWKNRKLDCGSMPLPLYHFTLIYKVDGYDKMRYDNISLTFVGVLWDYMEWRNVALYISYVRGAHYNRQNK
eukprot:scaffold2523_cov34-Prasinocladus_malaysianus.AAC.1